MCSYRNRLHLTSILVVSLFELVFGDTTSFKQNEICQSYSGRRIYLESSEYGTLQTTDASNSVYKNKVAKIERMSNGTANIHYQCQLELITCSACAFKINIIEANFTKNCDEDDDIDTCQCTDYLSFSEPPYDDNSPVKKWCGMAPFEFRSKSRVLVINYVYQFGHNNSFNLNYVSEKNVMLYQGFALSNDIIQNDTLTSPFFPTYYPRDLIIEHLIECNSSNATDCHIEITFIDFQVSTSSVMEFFDGNTGIVTQRYTGEIFRPPIIYSTSSSMAIRFYANGGTGLGYKANIRYLTETDINQTVNTHCGGLVESFGGAITMMNMTETIDETKVFDCIWLIKPPNNYLHIKTHILVRIDTIKKMADTSVVAIREGLTSESALLQEYETPFEEKTSETSFSAFVTTLTTGFYVSFRGEFNLESRFAIVYTTFSYMDCFPGPEFLCENHRCIPFFLQCDGFDHCGDQSDESDRCAPDEQKHAEANEFWLTHTPNYFFPKIDHYPDMKTAALVFLASAMSLIILILLLIVILYRMNDHVREQRELQSQLRTISELLDNTNAQTEDVENVHEQPPAYEHPPDYEEASSLKIDLNSRRSSEQMSNCKRKRSRSRSRCSIHCENSLLNTPSLSVTPVPSQITIPSLFLNDQCELLSTSFIECDVASMRNLSRRQSEPATVSAEYSRQSSQVFLIPESPPPEYTPRRSKMIRLIQSSSSSEQSAAANPSVSLEMPSNFIEEQTFTVNEQTNLTVSDQVFSHIQRRHSFQDQYNLNINADASISSDARDGFFNATPMNWLKNVDYILQKYSQCKTIQQRHFAKSLRRTSSENELLLLNQTNEHFMQDTSAVRRSFSSGLLF